MFALEPKVSGVNITKIQSVTLVKVTASVCSSAGPAAGAPAASFCSGKANVEGVQSSVSLKSDG